VTASREQLEQSVDESPDEAAGYAVLGDWLSQAGEPRGELIALQLEPRRTPAQRVREAELLKLRGIRIARARRAQWRWGFIHTLAFELTQADGWEDWRVPDGDRTWASELLDADLRHPSCRFLRELIVEGDPGDAALSWLSAHPPPLLRSLQLVCNEVDLSAVGAGLASLERLVLSCQFITPARVPLPGLTDLQLPLDALSSAGLALTLEGLAGTLRAVTLTSLEPVDTGSLAPLFGLAALESLTVRADAMSRGAIDELLDGPLSERLVTLDLSRSGLSAEAAGRLLRRAKGLTRLSSLVLGEAGGG
jgi:uncharacterized protein (TIGR02996 family)